MKVKGGRRKSWEGLPESASMADEVSFFENTQTNPLFLNPSLSAPSLLALDSQQEPHQPHDFTHENVDHPREPDEDDAHEADEEDFDLDLDVEDDDDDGEGDGDGDAEENAERPKLDEGFYEIEAIRRKRVRKGQLQYLIKWRGWPETANTWEPIENLQSCSDVIEAFEDNMRSGKRKRKRKSGILHTHVKKRHQRNHPIPIYNITGSEIVEVGTNLPSTGLDNLALTDLSVFPQSLSYDLHNCNGGIKGGETSKKAKAENGLSTVLRRSSGRRGGTGKEYDPKLSELKTTPPVSGSDKLAIQFQEAKASEGNGVAESPKVQSVEPVRSSTRSTGAKRRKSGSVKRFKQEPQLFEAAVVQNLTLGTDIVSGGRMEIHSEGYPIVAAENLNHKNNTDGPENVLRITKILKPIAYAASVTDDVQDVKVTFQVMRSDGMEVMVDNKFLKANNPDLLINYYEQHLRYNPSS